MVGEAVPEVKYTALASIGETGAINYISVTFQDRPQHNFVIARVVFQVGVLDDADITGGGFDRCADRVTFALVLLKENGFNDLRVFRLQFFDDLHGTIFRAIIHQDDFIGVHALDLLGHDAFEDFPQGAAFVINRDQD